MCDNTELTKDMKRVKHILEGENGNVEDGLVYKFAVQSAIVKRVERLNWFMATTIIAYVLINLFFEF